MNYILWSSVLSIVRTVNNPSPNPSFTLFHYRILLVRSAQMAMETTFDFTFIPRPQNSTHTTKLCLYLSDKMAATYDDYQRVRVK
jgi:hypothetical protein